MTPFCSLDFSNPFPDSSWTVTCTLPAMSARLAIAFQAEAVAVGGEGDIHGLVGYGLRRWDSHARYRRSGRDRRSAAGPGFNPARHNDMRRTSGHSGGFGDRLRQHQEAGFEVDHVIGNDRLEADLVYIVRPRTCHPAPPWA